MVLAKNEIVQDIQLLAELSQESADIIYLLKQQVFC